MKNTVSRLFRLDFSKFPNKKFFVETFQIFEKTVRLNLQTLPLYKSFNWIRPPYLLHKVDHLADGGDVVVVYGPGGDAAVEMSVVIGSFAAQVVNLESRQNITS